MFEEARFLPLVSVVVSPSASVRFVMPSRLASADAVTLSATCLEITLCGFVSLPVGSMWRNNTHVTTGPWDCKTFAMLAAGAGAGAAVVEAAGTDSSAAAGGASSAIFAALLLNFVYVCMSILQDPVYDKDSRLLGRATSCSSNHLRKIAIDVRCCQLSCACVLFSSSNMT